MIQFLLKNGADQSIKSKVYKHNRCIYITPYSNVIMCSCVMVYGTQGKLAYEVAMEYGQTISAEELLLQFADMVDQYFQSVVVC